MSGRACLLDTGPLVALLVRNDRNYERAKALFASVPIPLYTCEAVLSEACFLLSRTHADAPGAVMDMAYRGVFDLSFRLGEQAQAVAGIMKKYRNVPASLADACLVHMAQTLQTPRIMTFDGDFSVYRWGRNRSFEVL